MPGSTTIDCVAVDDERDGAADRAAAAVVLACVALLQDVHLRGAGRRERCAAARVLPGLNVLV